MLYIFMDESGDLGFNLNKKGTSKHFLITFIICKKFKSLDYILKKSFINLPIKYRKKHNGIFHFYKEKKQVRKIILKNFTKMILKENNVNICTVIFKKKNTMKFYLERDFYNNITLFLLKSIFDLGLFKKENRIVFIVSKRNTKQQYNIEFIEYLKSGVDCDLEIEIQKHNISKGLQIVDAISWSIYQKYEYDDYYNIFKDFVILEKTYDK